MANDVCHWNKVTAPPPVLSAKHTKRTLTCLADVKTIKVAVKLARFYILLPGFSRIFLPLPLPPHEICLSCPCDGSEGLKKKRGGGGEQIIVTCSKNSSQMAHHCAAVWGRPRCHLHILEGLWSGAGSFRSLIAVGAWVVMWPCTYTQVHHLCRRQRNRETEPRWVSGCGLPSYYRIAPIEWNDDKNWSFFLSFLVTSILRKDRMNRMSIEKCDQRLIGHAEDNTES